MRFVLHYRGLLKASRDTAHKHDPRKHFHLQLRTLWSQRPLSEQPELLQPKTAGHHSLLRPFAGFTFVPLVNDEMNAVAELSIVLLRPEPPGKLITKGGDIDNRLKTLFDALTMPRHSDSLPNGAAPTTDETPFFFCALEDDNLVTSVAVRTEQLLEPGIDPKFVDVTVHVQTRVTRPSMDNASLA
jgi:hypothetical protein